MPTPRIIPYLPHLTAAEHRALDEIERHISTLRRAIEGAQSDLENARRRKARIVNRASMRARSELGL